MTTAIDSAVGFRATDGALIRAVAHGELALPPWPTIADAGFDSAALWVDWLRRVWAIDVVRDVIGHASPDLAERVEKLCAAEAPDKRDTRRAGLSVARYLVRMIGRPTPNGLFAGVAFAGFAHRAQVRWGDRHRAIARADAGWLADLINHLEGCPEVLGRLPVMANTTLIARGDRLIVPYQPNPDQHGVVEVALRHTAPVRATLDAARAPIPFTDLCTQLHYGFPDQPPALITELLTELVRRRALLTSLHAPGTEPDALGHLLRELERAGGPATERAAELREIHRLLLEEQRRPATPARVVVGDNAATRMRRMARTRRHPVAIDLRLDAHILLPDVVAREAERAARLLARLSPYPYGTTEMADYHRRVYQRFGTGAQVPLLQLVADSGLGWPDGYPGTPPGPSRRLSRSRRDETLLALAQNAALDGCQEVVLDKELIAELDQASAGPARLPTHLELCTRVDAPSVDALERGDFRLTVTSVSRAAGVVTGRFLSLLNHQERDALVGKIVQSREPAVLLAQLSFPPLHPAAAHVTRSPRVLPTVISLAEHRDTAPAHVLTAADLAVSCDSHRLYLTAPALGKRVEAWGMHALNLRTHTPPLARLITELSAARHTQITDFDWGAATALPFLPRVRSGRIVLAPARWRVTAADLPGRDAAWAAWDGALAEWKLRRRLPPRVYLVDGDWRLPLSLHEDMHRLLLREHLATNAHALLEEGLAQDAAGWLDGRAHEIVIPLTARQPQPTTWPPHPTSQRIVHPGEHGLAPGASPLLFAKLYGDPQRDNVVLAEHLPALLAEWVEDQPRWWFLRFREGDEHCLRLRITLPSPEPAVFGRAAGRVSAWTDRLRRQGLLREVAFATSYPETGRWGPGPALTAAEAVFTADSRAVLTQLAQPERPHPYVLAAANFAAIAVAFTGGIEAGMRWLIDHIPAKPPAAVPRPVFTEAQSLGDPREDFRALRSAPGGAEIVATWAQRDRALAAYRSQLDGADAEGVDPDAALSSLLHSHFLRACGIEPEDKAACLYLARTAALTYTARTGGAR